MRPWPVLLLLGCGRVGIDDGRTPTFHKDVRPVMEGVCARCHDGSGIAPFPLTTYDEVKAVAPLVASAVADRRMPPWLAGDGCTDYQDDLSLTQDEIDGIVAWADGGTPEGDPADAPQAPAPVGPALPRVDHVLELPIEYTPGEVEDDYRCFVLDWPDPALVTSVTGYTVVPGDDRIVHHVIAYIVPPVYALDYDALDGQDGRAGYECFGGVGGPAPTRSDTEEGTRWLGGWAPGGMGGAFPEGTGIPVEAGSRIVIQVHYHPLPSEPGRADRSRVEVMVDPTVPMSNWALILPFADPLWVDYATMPIPANTNGVSHSVSMEMPEPFVIHSANLHMHTHGRSGRLAVDHTSGAEDCLLDIPRWDFAWQRPYRLQDTVEVAAGDHLELSCTWDNPTNEDLNWGEGTNDEMCLATMYVTSPAGR